MSRAMSVIVSIGARLNPSLNSSVSRTVSSIDRIGKRLTLLRAESKLAARELAGVSKALGSMAATGGLSFGFTKTIKSGASFMREVNMLRVSGRTAEEVGKSMRQARITASEVPTSTLTGNLQLIRETTGAYGKLSHALENLSFNQRLAYMMTTATGKSMEESQHNLVAGIQALEIRGSAMDIARYRREMQGLFQAMVFFSGKEGAFSPVELRNFAKTGNIPLKLMGERFMTRILPSLVTETGSGDIIGTQATAFNNWLNGNTGTGNKSKTQFAQKIGLVTQTDQSQLTKTGWRPGAVLGTGLAKEDPFKWVESILIPRLEKAGFNTNDTKSLEIGISSLFGRETAKRFVMGLADPLQRKRLHLEESNINKAMGSEQGYKFMLENDPTMAWARVMSKMENLATILGEKVFTDKTISAIDKFATGIEKLSSFFDKNPTLAKATVAGMGIGSAAGIMSMLGGGALVKTFFRVLSKPFRMAWSMLFSGVGAMGPKLPLAHRLGALLMTGLRGIGSKFRAGISRLGPILMSAIRGFGRFAMSGFRALGPFVMSGLRALGPFMMAGLRTFGPLLLRGLALGFALLSNPAGWATILAGVSAALVYYFRDDIARWWQSTFMPAWHKFWADTAQDVLTHDWASIGMRVGDLLTGGLLSKLRSGDFAGAIAAAFSGPLAMFSPGAAAGVAAGIFVNTPTAKTAAASPRTRTSSPPGHGVRKAGAHAPLSPAAVAGIWANTSPGKMGAPAAHHVAGKRALGGPVGLGRTYLVGERGPELFTAPANGKIIPANDTARMMRGDGQRSAGRASASGGTFHLTVNVNGATDPQAVARAVRSEFERLARAQGANLND